MVKPITELNVNDRIKFGRYSIGDSFVLPIIWRIIDKNHEGYPDKSLTLLTDEIIDLCAFDSKLLPERHQPSRGNSLYSNSDIRKWLNNKFLDTFTNNELSKILETELLTIKNGQSPNNEVVDDLIENRSLFR